MRDKLKGFGILTPIQKAFLSAFSIAADQGFDLYWFAVALNRAEAFPNKAERWPVKMLKPFDPVKIKQLFLELAIKMMEK